MFYKKFLISKDITYKMYFMFYGKIIGNGNGTSIPRIGIQGRIMEKPRTITYLVIVNHPKLSMTTVGK